MFPLGIPSLFRLWSSINELRNPLQGVLMRDMPMCVCVCVCVCECVCEWERVRERETTWHEEWAWEARAGRFGGGIARWVPVVVSCTGRRSVHLQHKHRDTRRHSQVWSKYYLLSSEAPTWTQPGKYFSSLILLSGNQLQMDIISTKSFWMTDT